MDFVKKPYYAIKNQQQNDLLLLATKVIEKILHAGNAKEYNQFHSKKKNTKLISRSKIITQQSKTIENPNIIDIKSVNIEHPKTSGKLSKGIRQIEKFS